jgi:hypothetical protein
MSQKIPVPAVPNVDLNADIPFNIPSVGFHVTVTRIPFDEDKKEKSTHHLVLGCDNEAEAIAAAQERWFSGGPIGFRERWTAERCIRMNRPDNDKTIVFKL